MARRSRSRRRITPINTQLNFIIVLALAFFLVIAVSAVMNQVAIRTRANIVCGPTPTLPAEKCETGWSFARDADGCAVFRCP